MCTKEQSKKIFRIFFLSTGLDFLNIVCFNYLKWSTKPPGAYLSNSLGWGLFGSGSLLVKLGFRGGDLIDHLRYSLINIHGNTNMCKQNASLTLPELGFFENLTAGG